MMLSNRARRMAQNHMRHKAGFELNLIPLIDILSVMVSFLLVYSTEVEVIQNSKGVQIPQSISQVAPTHSVVVTISTSKLFVQDELIGGIAQLQATPDVMTAPLLAALKRALPEAGGGDGASAPAPNVTIMADKTLPYEVLKKVMATCTEAGYGRISLAVTQKEKQVSAANLPPGL